MDCHTEQMEEVLANSALVLTCGRVMVEVGVGKNMYFNSDSMLDVPVDRLLQYYGIGRSKCVSS